MTQPALFGELLPALEGCIQGIVGKRPGKHGQHEWDLQCQHCYAIETPKHLILMTYKFPPCTEEKYGSGRLRVCPDCHVEICTGHPSCKGMPGMKGHYA